MLDRVPAGFALECRCNAAKESLIGLARVAADNAVGKDSEKQIGPYTPKYLQLPKPFFVGDFGILYRAF